MMKRQEKKKRGKRINNLQMMNGWDIILGIIKSANPQGPLSISFDVFTKSKFFAANNYSSCVIDNTIQLTKAIKHLRYIHLSLRIKPPLPKTLVKYRIKRMVNKRRRLPETGCRKPGKIF